eukprot:gene28004-31101_t
MRISNISHGGSFSSNPSTSYGSKTKRRPAVYSFPRLSGVLGHPARIPAYDKALRRATRCRGYMPPGQPFGETSPVEVHDEGCPSDGWRWRPHHLSKHQLWQRCRGEATEDAVAEQRLASNLYSTVLSHPSLEKCLAFILSKAIGDPNMVGTLQLMILFQETYAAAPDLVECAVCDIMAVKDRDPAFDQYM